LVWQILGYTKIISHRSSQELNLMTGNTIKEKIVAVLREAHPALNQLQDEFFVIGAAALIISGIPINDTMDIDLLTSSRDADKLKVLWKDRRLNYKPSEITRFKSNFARFQFDFLDVEVMGDLEVYSEGQWCKVTVNDFKLFPLNDSQIKVPTLGEQVRILQLFGRQKDKDKIGLIRKMA
jgi:hypothetical protein